MIFLNVLSLKVRPCAAMAIESVAIISIARSLGGMVATASVVTIWFARVRDLARLQSIDSDQIPTTIHAVLCQVLSVHVCRRNSFIYCVCAFLGTSAMEYVTVTTFLAVTI